MRSPAGSFRIFLVKNKIKRPGRMELYNGFDCQKVMEQNDTLFNKFNVKKILVFIFYS